jgi:hypothetical protein
MRGGYRQNAGRKMGFSAKNAEEARKLLSKKVAQEIGPIGDILISEAKKGNIRAIRELFDRAWGRPRQEVEIANPPTENLSKPTGEVLELINKLTNVQK